MPGNALFPGYFVAGLHSAFDMLIGKTFIVHEENKCPAFPCRVTALVSSSVLLCAPRTHIIMFFEFAFLSDSTWLNGMLKS